MARFWWWLFLAAATPALFGQSAELDQLVAESARVRALIKTGGEVDSTDLKSLLRDWIETRLPANATELNAEFPSLEARLTADLRRAGLWKPEKSTADFGYIATLKLSRPESYPGGLMVQAGVTVGCGTDVSLYLYHFTATARARILEANGTHKWGSEFLEAAFSVPDSSGSRIFYASWYGVQCGSVWNLLDYRLFRISADGNRAVSVFSGTHSFVFDEGPNVKLTAEELRIELTDRAMEGGERRTHVLHYRIGQSSVERIDPVALQAQDFVHEWITRPWNEMQSRSAGGLPEWHRLLQTGRGEYVLVQPCADRAGVTQVVVQMDRVGTVSFLVRDKGDHHYEMSEISFTRQAGCSN